MKFSASYSIVFCALVLLLTGPVNVTAQCSDVHIVFARGSGEMPGLGICGTPLVSGIKQNLAGMSVSSYAVNYLASVTQTSAGPGATDMTNHVKTVAQQCRTLYSFLADTLKTMLGVGASIPEELAPRIKAIVTFGNPLKLMGQTIERSSQLYGSKAIEFCNLGDPVCANGFNTMAHITYPMDGSVTKAAAQAAALVKGNARALRG
ncbi:hypothetical protein PPTG_07182 [Phytophthora nicotianae INRA-310]|uniref:Cutinase n=1 Tax=Phytophthora nicotianae (strain INRA-310) TaxID=761204 RepID=W2QP28_PHYN3|nr:hypothetical protein PPTG_07182 [Phytophthora nicotianae INRA-310]ETN14942.1 hypothetical protein PPTG_07182 [Phytophthora nicotianae INRA-310]